MHVWLRLLYNVFWALNSEVLRKFGRNIFRDPGNSDLD